MQRSFIVCTVLFLLCAFSAIAQEKKTVSGTVLDEKGSPLVGVSVQEKGTTHGATTNPDGSFKLQVSSNATLVISYIGYLKQELPADAVSGNIKLEPDSKGLNEVVVTAMGIRKEARALGYAVSTVSSKELTQTGSTNFASALYGKAAGVKIVSAPGGASSAVSVQVRGVSSVGLSTQPLYVVDGVPIRNFNNLTSGSFGTTNGRIDGNGALDINPEDIESLTILKGASATALYGSEATNGVVVITTKKGVKNKGLGVDLSYTYTQEKLALSPDYQNDYGPGYDMATNLANGYTADGWYANADGSVRPYYRAYGQFGPKFDGREVSYWDGSTKKYSANPDNYKDFYETGHNSIVNLAMSNATDKGSFRLSATRTDYKSIMPGSNMYKNNFNFNGTLKLSNKVSVDLVSTYNNSYVHNRANVVTNIFGSYGGFFSRMDDMNTYKRKYRTTDGYKYVTYNNNSYDQDEKILYNIRATQLLDYLWDNLRNSYDETQNRFINSATLNISILDNLRVRGRVGGDFTSLSTSNEQHNTQPAALGYTGMYAVESRNNNVFYGDAMAIYNPRLSKDLDLTITGGFTGRKQTYKYQTISTQGGLVSENWFSLVNSANALASSSVRAEQMDVAGFGMLNLNYKSFLYIEGTGRYESTSTLPVAVNSYFYPSFNAGFILSDVVKMPKAVDYAKLRASYGFVGNHPNLYQSNVLYNQYTVTYNDANLLYQQPNNSGFGNEALKSEKKREMEFGLETRLLNNKVSVDFSYYNNKVMNQILTMSTAASNGATSMLVNAGDISNYGYEAAISATPVALKDFRWNTRFNFAVNRNKLTSLNGSETNLTSASYDGGYLIIRSQVGDALGNIYVHPRATDDKGNLMVNDDGIHYNNTSDYKYAGNIMPKIVGGFSNTLSYKNLSLDFTLDYRFGGKLISLPTYYQIGAGMYKSTLKYRDAAHGGISYNVVDASTNSFVAAANGTHNDGVILDGVTSTGATNTKVISAAQYYLNGYEWEGNGDYSAAVFNNSYVKLREVALTYNMPKSLVSKLHFQGLQFSLIGRNLLYVYKSLPHGLDPEAAVGSSWLSQGVDGGTAGPTRSLGASLRARF